MAKPAPDPDDAPSELIDARIDALEDWRGVTLAALRALIKRAAPNVSRMEVAQAHQPRGPRVVPPRNDLHR